MGTCPDCAQDSGKVHSRYTRTPADVSLMDYAVRLRVQVRRFFCSNLACARTTFAEAFADLAEPYARRTTRQVNRLRAIATELGGRPAARESENVQMPVSRHTMLRLLRRTPVFCKLKLINAKLALGRSTDVCGSFFNRR